MIIHDTTLSAYNRANNDKPLTLLEDMRLSYHAGMLLDKNSVRLEPFNWAIGRLNAAGLPNYWYKKYTGLDKASPKADRVGPKKLTIHQLAVGFAVSLALLVPAGIAFVFEVFIGKLKANSRLVLQLF